MIKNIKKTLKDSWGKYWPLIKSLQTGLLLVTGWAGFMSGRCPILYIDTLMSLTGSLFLAISGSTVLNMWYDRDIDARMKRTCWRPLPAEKIAPGEALNFGLVLSILGVAWASAVDLLYGAIVFAGLFFDVIIYTIWLKRRSAWSIIFGGISGGMPALAGRTLAVGHIDWVGIALALAILFWIPTHILTFSMRYHEDYKSAGIPTFPSRYSFQFTRVTIAISSLLAAIAMGIAAFGFGLSWGYLRMMAVLAGGLLVLAIGSLIKPSEKINFGLFKYASLYMFGTMLMIIFAAI